MRSRDKQDNAFASLSHQLHCAPSPKIPISPTQGTGVDSRGSCDQSRTAPLHSSCLLTIPPALAWAFSHGMQSSRKTKMLKHGFSTGCASLGNSPPASIWVPPSVLYLPVSCFFHPLPVLSHFRFLWGNPLLCSTKSSTALIWVWL